MFQTNNKCPTNSYDYNLPLVNILSQLPRDYKSLNRNDKV